MSHQALKVFGCVIDISSVTLGSYDKRCILVTDLERAERKAPPPPHVEGDAYNNLWDVVPASGDVDLYKRFINHSAVFKLQADINQSKLFRLECGLAELMSLYELRQVSTVFTKIGSLRFTSKDSLEDAQTAMTIVQTALKKYEGSLRQFHVDDKGSVILSFFGLPPLAHENDASFAVQAALEISSEFGAAFDDFSIGITTGVVSIGGVGNAIRTEYAVVSDFFKY